MPRPEPRRCRLSGLMDVILMMDHDTEMNAMKNIIRQLLKIILPVMLFGGVFFPIAGLAVFSNSPITSHPTHGLPWESLSGDLTGISFAQVVTPTQVTPAIILIEPTATATQQPDQAEATPTPYQRPLIVVDTYSASVNEVSPGSQFNLVVRLRNVGQLAASNIVATFAAGDFIPRETGGVVAVNKLDPGDKRKIEQPLTASYDIWGSLVGSISVQLNYTDVNGTTYSETFNLTLSVAQPRGVGATATLTPTPTVEPRLRPQLLISAYQSDVDILQPGSRFVLSLQINNVGNAKARSVTMILGGGGATGGTTGGTPDPTGGVSGASGDFGNFAPVASSNVQFLGDLDQTQSLSSSAELIVNASTNPGAYPMKISFSYTTEDGTIYTDDQVITMLVYSLPQVEVNFYRETGPVFLGQPNQLPIQIVNLGRKTTLLGNMRISVAGAQQENGLGPQLTNNVVLVGALDTGGYYTLDAMLIPDQPGPLELVATIDYTDDFNQSQVITKTLQVMVEDMPIMEPVPGENGMPLDGGFPGPVLEDETVWQKVVRFLRGLVGLDSAKPAQPGEIFPGEIMPDQEVPFPAGNMPKG
jgi:hypothetical protein